MSSGEPEEIKADDPSERSLTDSEKATVRRCYLNALASSICINCQTKFKNFRKPPDSIAQRIANEYVANYLVDHMLDSSAATADKESKHFLIERHSRVWIARHLKLDPNMPLCNQLLNILGKKQTNNQSPQEKYNEILPKVPTKIKARGKVVELLDSNDGEFTSFCVTSAEPPEQPRAITVERKMQYINEDDIETMFTALEPEPPKKIPRLYQPKYQKKRKSKSSTKHRPKIDNFVDNKEDLYSTIDTKEK